MPLSLLSPQGCKRSLRALGPQGMGWLWLSTLESLCERSSQAGRGESIVPTLPGLGSCLLLLGASCEKVTVAEVLMGISLCHVSTLTLFWLWPLASSWGCSGSWPRTRHLEGPGPDVARDAPRSSRADLNRPSSDGGRWGSQRWNPHAQPPSCSHVAASPKCSQL